MKRKSRTKKTSMEEEDEGRNGILVLVLALVLIAMVREDSRSILSYLYINIKLVSNLTDDRDNK